MWATTEKFTVRVKIITGSLVTLENWFPPNYRYRLEIRMNSFNYRYRYRLGVRSHPFISIDSQLPSWKSCELIFRNYRYRCSGRQKAHKHKLFALVNVQMALGQTVGCTGVNRAKKFMCSPRNTGNINSSLWLTGGLPQRCPDFQKVYVFKVYVPFLVLSYRLEMFQRTAKGASGRGHVKKRQKSSKSVKNIFDTFRHFSRRAKTSKIVKNIFDTFWQFRAAPFLRPLLGGSECFWIRKVIISNMTNPLLLTPW